MNDPLQYPNERIPQPSDWQTLYVIFLHRVQASTNEQASVMEQHTQYQLRLQASGKAVAAGELSQGQENHLVTHELAGMTILRAVSQQEAEAIISADPAIRAGIFTAEVRSWRIPAGRILPGGW